MIWDSTVEQLKYWVCQKNVFMLQVELICNIIDRHQQKHPNFILTTFPNFKIGIIMIKIKGNAESVCSEMAAKKLKRVSSRRQYPKVIEF